MLDQELANWKRTQRLCCGQEEMPNKKELDQLQQWCEQLAELLWRNRIQIRQVSMHVSTHAAYIHTHTHARTHTRAHTHTHVRAHTRTHTDTLTSMNIYVYLSLV